MVILAHIPMEVFDVPVHIVWTYSSSHSSPTAPIDFLNVVFEAIVIFHDLRGGRNRNLLHLRNVIAFVLQRRVCL